MIWTKEEESNGSLNILHIVSKKSLIRYQHTNRSNQLLGIRAKKLEMYRIHLGMPLRISVGSILNDQNKIIQQVILDSNQTRLVNQIALLKTSSENINSWALIMHSRLQ